jgi:hypothetical protein
VEDEGRANIAESQQRPYAPDTAAEGYTPGPYRQYAERVPRYTAPAPDVPGRSDQPPAPDPAAGRTPADQTLTGELPVAPAATGQAGRAATDQPPAEPVTDPSANQTAAPEAPVAQPYPTDPTTYGEAEVRFEPRTNALPTVPRTGGQPGGQPTGEPSLPPSLSSMLDHRTEPIGRPGYQPGQQAPQQVPQQRQRARRSAQPGSGNPAVRAAVVLFTLLAAVPPVWVLYDGLAGGDRISAAGVIGGTLMLIGLPALAAGLYPIVNGAAEPPDGVWAWLRPPLVYLPIGLVLLVAAGLAAS